MAYAAKNISLHEMDECTGNVFRSLITSNQLLLRKDYPYYHSQVGIPPALVSFKAKITSLRAKSSELILERYKDDPHPMGLTYSMGSFSHAFTGALTVAAIGIGDCGECCAKLAAEMICKSFGNITFLSLSFPKAKKGMEQYHQLILANISKEEMGLIMRHKERRLDAFLALLPKHCVIGDPFLGLSFTPAKIPKPLQDYIIAYGEEAIITNCQHFTHLGPKFLEYYLKRAAAIKSIIAEMPEAKLNFYITEGPWKAILEASHSSMAAEKSLAPK